ncbi:MAG TPA: translocation/assembly module TamB domain-containing protein [Myxococcota bacterium]
MRLPRRRPKLPIRLGIFLALLLVGVRALLSEPTLTFAIDQLAARLHDELGLTLVVAHIEADAQSARVEMGPVILKGNDDQVLFSADKIVADVAPLKFFERRLRLEHLEIDNPKINLRIVDGKIAGVRTPDKPSSSDPLLKVDVADFQLHDGVVDVGVSSKDKVLVKTHLGGIEMRLRDRGRDEHRLRFTVKDAEARRPLKDGSDDVIAADSFGGRIVVHGDGLLSPTRIDVSDVTLDADHAEVSVAGAILLGAAGLAPAFEADLSARADLAPALKHLHLALPITGGANLTAHISGKPGGEDLLATAQLDTTGVDVDNLHLGSLRARVRADKEHVDIESASWDWAESTIHGTATVQFDDVMHAKVKAEANGFSIYQLMHNMGVPGAWADARIDDGAVEVAGTLHPLLLEGKGHGTFTDILVASMDVRKAPADRIVLHTSHPVVAHDVALRVDTEGIRFEGGVDDGFTRANGVFQIYYDVNKGLYIDAQADSADFASVDGRIADLAFTGVGRGHMHVEGPQTGPVLTAELEIGGFSLEDFAFGDATGRVHLFKDDLRFEDVVAVKNGRSRYGGLVALNFTPKADEHGVVQKTPNLSIDLGFDPAAAEDLRAVIPEKYTAGVLDFLREDLDLTGPVKGRFIADGAVGGGTFDHMKGEGKLELLPGAALLDQHLTGDGAFHMDLDRFYIDGLDVAVGAPRAAAPALGAGHITASVGRADATLDGAIDIHGIQLSDIDALKDAAKPFRGTFDVDGKLGQSAHDPGFIGRAVVHGAGYGNVPIGDADVSLDHKGRVLTLTGKVLSGRGDGTVHVETRSPFNYDAAVAVSEGPLGPMLPATLLPSGVSIAVKGDVDARGALKTFRDSRGALALKKLDVDARGLVLASKSDAAAHFHGTRLTFDLLDLVDKDGDLVSLRGLVADDALDVSVAGNGKLSALPKLWPKAKSADGRFTFDVAVTGDLDHAAMSGQGNIAGGKLTFAGLGAGDGAFPALDDIDAQIAFRGPNVVIEHASAKADGAPITMQGAVTLEGPSPKYYDLELRYQHMKLALPSPPIETLSSGRLALKGDAALPTLSGEVHVLSARYTDDINWERLLPDLRRRGSALASLKTDNEDVRFDVHLIADRGIVVDNNVLDLEAKGDLFLTGTEERPGLKGGIQLMRGNATFRGNQYRLSRGTVDFVDTYRIMPVLDVEAETRVRDYDVTAHLSGPAQAPQIDLTSRPELSEIDIVSLLTFGFTQFEVRDAGGSAGAAGLEVVSAYTGLDKELRRVLPEAVRKSSALQLDELRLTSAFSERAGASVPAVALGMEVNPGLWGIDGSRLRLQSTLVDTTGSGTEQRVEWEKRFDNNIRLRMSWSSEDTGTCPSCTNQWGDLGGDVWYRWEF